MNKRPNILWYCTDQQRHDTIGSLGNPHVRTPNIDRLKAGGTAFTRAYAQSPICTPSRASFLTGRYPATTHVHRNGNAGFPESETLVTRIFADAGYDCGLIGKLHLASAANGVEARTDDGYAVFEYSHDPLPREHSNGNAYHQWLIEEKGVEPAEAYANSREYLCDGVPAELHQTTWATDRAIDFIESRQDTPWLLSINVFDPHPPFDPPKSYRNKYRPEDMPPPLFRPSDLERQKDFAEVSQQSVVAVDPTEAAVAEPASANTATIPPKSFNGQEIKAAYYAMIELIDDEFGRLVDYLEDSGQLENTLIVFHSDHGEMLGDHGLLYKGCRFFEGLVHVPLMFFWQGRFVSGVEADALVELVDLAPTLLEAAGLPVPASMQGKSLVPILEGKAGADSHKPVVVCEFNDALGSNEFPRPTHATMTFDGRYKTIVYHGLDLGEIFDLETDPGEFVNLWNDGCAPGLKERLLHQHLDAVMATSSAGVERVAGY